MVAPVISADVPRIQTYTASDGQTEFPIAFAYLADSDVRVEVWRGGALVAAYVGGDGDMSCDPAEDAELVEGVAGTATIPACEADDVVHVFAMTTPERDVIYTNPADVTRDNLNREANRRVAVEAELREAAARAIAARHGETGFLLQSVADRASQLAMFAANGDLLGAGVDAGQIATLIANLEAIEALAAAIETQGVAGGLGVIATGALVSRALSDRAAERIGPRDFGALADGTGTTVAQWLTGGTHASRVNNGAGYASLAALQADYPAVTSTADTIDWAATARMQTFAAAMMPRKLVDYGPGRYVFNRALPPVSGSYWRWRGAGKQTTNLIFLVHCEAISIDVSAAHSLFGGMCDLTVTFPSSVSTASKMFRAIGSIGSATGLQYFTFERVETQNAYKGIYFDDTGMTDWLGVNQISSHGYNNIIDFETLPGTNPTHTAVEYVGAMNLHNLFIGGRWRGYSRALKAGKDATLCSVGDTIAIGVHFLSGTGPGTEGICVELIGGSDALSYNENFHAIGCQYECTEAPFKLTRCDNMRFMGSNTNDLPPILVDCDEASIWYEVRGYAHIPGGRPLANLAHNPAFDVWQRGTSFASGGYARMADRWGGRRSGAAAGATYSRQAGFAGARYCMRMQRNAANADTSSIMLAQQLPSEACDPLNGRTIVVSADVRAGADYSGGDLTLSVFTGTGTDEAYNPATGFATGNVNEASSAQAIPSGSTRIRWSATDLQANPTELGITIAWTPTGTAGAADYVEITNVKIEIGGAATEFEPPDLAAEIVRCQRYFRKSFDLDTTPAQAAGVGSGELTWTAVSAGATLNRSPRVHFHPPMRVTTGLAFTPYNPAAANSQARDESAAADCSSTAVSNLTQTGFSINTTGNVSTAVAGLLGLHWTCADPVY